MPNPMNPMEPTQPLEMNPTIPSIEEPIDISSDITLDRPASEVREEEKEREKSVQFSISSEKKKEIVMYIKKLVQAASDGRSEWLDNRRECIDLYNQIRAAKSDPWPGCSNITTGIAPMHVNIMHSKLLPAVWNPTNIYWKPVEKADVVNVEQIQKFMNWVIQQDMKLADNIDDIILSLIIEGTVALKVRWDTEYRRVKRPNGYEEIAHEKAILENVPIDQVYLPYLWKHDSASPEEEAEFIAQESYMRFPDIKEHKKRNKFMCSDEDLEKVEGAVGKTMDETLLKKKSDAEGTSEYYAHLNSEPIRIIECYMKYELPTEDGGSELVDSVFSIAPDSDTYLSGKPLTEVSPTGLRPWVIGQFIRRVGRPYGIGLLELVKNLAKELDAIHNQRIDAGTIAIAPFGFYRAASSFRPANVKIGPGVFIPVDNIDDVKIAQFPASNLAVSFQEERIIIEYIEKLTATSAYQQGRESDIVKSRATATGTMAIIAQGEQSYTILGLRAQRIISKAITKVLHLYQAFMPPEMPQRILNEKTGELLMPGLSSEKIAGGYDAYMVLDATAGTKAMEQQANQVMLQRATQLLTLAQDPRGYAMAEEFLKSIGKLEIEKFLGPKPKPGQKPTAQGLMGAAPMGPGADNNMAAALQGGGQGV